jgi:hypothetical protein
MCLSVCVKERGSQRGREGGREGERERERNVIPFFGGGEFHALRGGGERA